MCLARSSYSVYDNTVPEGRAVLRSKLSGHLGLSEHGWPADSGIVFQNSTWTRLYESQKKYHNAGASSVDAVVRKAQAYWRKEIGPGKQAWIDSICVGIL